MVSPRVRHVAPFLAAFALVAFTTPAEAQLGGMIRRAAGKAAEKAVSKAVEPSIADRPGCTPTFDRYTIELTEEVVDKLLAGWKAQAEAGAAAGRPGLVRERDQLELRLEDFEDDPVLERFRERQSEWQGCRSEALGAFYQQKYGDNPMAWIAGDPERQRRVRELEERAAAAEGRGDVEAAKRIRDSTTYAYFGGAALGAEEQAAVDAKCGKAPTMPKRLQQRDSLRVALRGVEEKIQAIDDAHGDVLYETSGLSRRQVAVAEERIAVFLRSKDAPCGYSAAELSALAKRRAELGTYVK
jgi:hypothetical protein